MEVTQRLNPRYVAVLAAAASLILIVGWVSRPRDIPASPPAVPSETELQELAKRTERRSLESMTAYFAELASDVRASIVYIPSTAASGIIWDETRVVTGPIPIAPESRTVVVRTIAGERGGAPTTSSRRLPLSSVNAAIAPSSSVAHRAAAPPAAGNWVVAVWQTDRASAFAPATFTHLAAARCGQADVREVTSSLSFSRDMIGGGLFNMDGELLGMILPCGDRVTVIEPSSIDGMLERLMSVTDRVLADYGVMFSALSQDERDYFGEAKGLFAREVWIGTPAERAGLRPGDLAVAVAGQPVTTLDDLRPLTTQSEAPLEFRLRRGAKIETLTLASSAMGEPGIGAATIGVVLELANPAYRIESLLAGSRAARAGLQPGDRLVRIDGREPRNHAQAERTTTSSASAPIMLEIQRDRRRIAVVIPESAPR